MFLGLVLNRYLVLFKMKFKIENVKKSFDYIFFFLIFSIVLEFMYSGYIPIVEFVNGNMSYGDKAFGIKTFHLFIFTLASFYAIFLFHEYLSTKNKFILLKFLILYTYQFLLMSRSSFLMVTISVVLLYLFSVDRVSKKSILKIFTFGLLMLYTFGLLGNIRETANSTFMIIAKPTENFSNSSIPEEFIWSYIYISSPIATLQYNISKSKNISLDKFLVSSIAPDIISKRIKGYDSVSRIYQLESWLTVGSQYSKAYKYLGWSGMYLIFFLMSAFIFFWTILSSKNNKYFLTGYTVLLTMVLFGVFNNMWVYSALSFQLIYPYILNKLSKISYRKKYNAR